jgi:hypothetical protein
MKNQKRTKGGKKGQNSTLPPSAEKELALPVQFVEPKKKVKTPSLKKSPASPGSSLESPLVMEIEDKVQKDLGSQS